MPAACCASGSGGANWPSCSSKAQESCCRSVGCFQLGHTVVQHSHQGSDMEAAGRFAEAGSPNTTETKSAKTPKKYLHGILFWTQSLQVQAGSSVVIPKSTV